MVHGVLLTALFALSGAPLQTAIDRAVAAPALAHASVGIAVYDLDRHRMLYARNADRYFFAASTTKLLTEGATLAFLGPQYRFQTDVFRAGAVDAAGTLHGDVVLRASGDPNLSARVRPDDTLAFENEDHSYDGGAQTRAVPGNPLRVLDELAAQIVARGISAVTGGVRIDDSLFNADFAESGTGAAVSAIVVNDNLIDVTVHPGSAAGSPAAITISPQTSYASFVNEASTCAKGTPARITMQDGGKDAAPHQTVTIRGCVPPGPPLLYSYDVPSPRFFAQAAFRDALERAGISIAGAPSSSPATYTSEEMIASHRSPPLREDVKVTLKVSDNLHADIMPYLWAAGDAAKAFAMERRWLANAGLAPGGVVQNDGLGGDAYIQPAFMVQYLAFMRRERDFASFQRALPVMGKDGTLFDVERASPAAGHVYAKTGTWIENDALNARRIVTAKALAGYIDTRSRRHVAFCVYVNNVPVQANGDPARALGDALGAVATAIYSRTP